MPNEIREFQSFMDFALGINSLTGDIRGQAVTRTPGDPVPNADGQTVIFRVHSVTSISDIHKALGVDAEASAAFLGGGGSATFNFAESSSFHSFSSFLLVSSIVTNASRHMLNEGLVVDAQNLISAGQLDRFSQEFGDLYIKGIETGGRFVSLIEVVTTDSTDQTNVAASLSVEAFIGGAEDMSAHFSSSSMKSLSNHHLDINSFQSGGQAGSAVQFLTADQMLNAATAFAGAVASHPVPYRVELQDYQSLNLPPPPNAADIQNAKDVVADCLTRRATWLQFRNDIAFILSHPEQFQTPAHDLSALDNLGANNLNQINTAASSCLNNLKACKFVSIPEPDRSLLPNRNPAVQTVTVPNFIGLQARSVGNANVANIAALGPGVAPDLVLFFFERIGGQPEPIPFPVTPPVDFIIASQQPAAGTVVTRHSQVSLFAPGISGITISG